MNAVSSTRLCPEAKPWYAAASRGVSELANVANLKMATKHQLCPEAPPWCPVLPQVQKTEQTQQLPRNQRTSKPSSLTPTILLVTKLASILATSLSRRWAAAHKILSNIADAMGSLLCLPALAFGRHPSSPLPPEVRPNKSKPKPNKYCVMASKILRKNKHNRKQTDKARRLRRYP